ncbi:MAG: acetylornithine deacetylase [Geminicoccaceae bacterium]|nr:acetylornithine deacetylase [Geminicoccaceae bacterium]
MNVQGAARPPVQDLLAGLVAFDTVSRNSNLPMLEHVRAFLDAQGIASSIAVDPHDSGKAGLLATIGPADAPGIVLSGHMDVVPVDGQPWSSDPFTARFDGGRIYGRGTCDMKGFLAACLSVVPAIRDMDLVRPVHLAFSHDEEVGCKGSKVLLDHMKERLPHRPLGCVVGEPTQMKPVDGHKGKIAARVTITGREGHSALTHETVNAVLHAGRLIGHLADVADRLAAEAPAAGRGFLPPHTTMSIGRIEGGSQINIVPRSCTFEMEFRTLPGEDPQEHLARVIDHARTHLLPDMKERAEEADIAFSTFLAYPGFRAPAGDPFVATCIDLAGGDPPGKVSYGTEAGWFQDYDIPTIVCGPGDMSVAHKPDEHVETAQLDLARTFILDLAGKLAT